MASNKTPATDTSPKADKTRKELPKGLYWRGDTIWMRYSAGGEQQRESCDTDDVKKAISLREKRRTAIFEGKWTPDKKNDPITVNQLNQKWLEHAQDKDSIEDDRHRFKKICETQVKKGSVGNAMVPMGELFIHEVTYDHCLELKKNLEKTITFRGTPMHPTTVNRHLALLRSAFNFATKAGYQHKNPMAAIRFNKEAQRERICSEKEYEALIDGADPELRLAIVMAYWCGFRESEIATLERSQIDLKGGFVALDREDTKTDEKRLVPLSSDATRELEAYLASREVVQLGRIMDWSGHDISKYFGIRVRKLEFNDLRFHDLRHTALTRLHKMGVDQITLKKISGHKTLATLDRYVHPDAQTLREAMDKVDAGRAQNKK